MAGDFIATLGQKILENEENLAYRIRDLYYEEYEKDARDLNENESQYNMVELLHRIGKTLLENNGQDTNSSIEEWGATFGKTAVQSGVAIDKAMLGLPFFRKVMEELIRSEFKKTDRPVEDYFQAVDYINPIVDRTIYAFSHAYVEYNEDTFKKAKEELTELSVPVVPLTKEVAILPIIGTIDTHRSKELLDKSLNRGRELELAYLIVDLSGVDIIDTAIAHNLFQLNDALRVIGVTAIFSGLRPELAQTIVNLGISFENMRVVSDLEQALTVTGLKIKENNPNLTI
ncbi:STAS domain-containing protein [Salipaludibacillus aurantiacus]|uniref:RsbT co-antagonist protein RsbR n=1 Tax=Salipaludibacillus aurantiacus TaxID=1601833 RepID=A0A1H9RR92_9BACI|nr:STAS domain-containing protein [Salipaludibacillus aurantiacus]SER75312.1 rsbT co-antagonist protein RsbR [Salipaludibacillus aurantiacus]